MWERMQQELDARIKKAGAQNAYFPMFIPQSYLTREAEHVEGFAPELAVVTHGGGKELEEPIVVRPTSETIINEYFSKWVQSHRDLPAADQPVGQRGPLGAAPAALPAHHRVPLAGGPHRARHLRGRPRLRLADPHDVYADFMTNVLGIDVVLGRKTAKERFAGAINTLTLEGDDGRRQGAADGHQPRAGPELRQGLQHHLPAAGRRARARLADLLGRLHPDGRRPDHVARRRQRPAGAAAAGGRPRPSCWPSRATTRCWPRSARSAPELEAAGIRVVVDDRTDTPFGRRAVDWELKGVPVRIEVGPRDLENGTAMLARRIPGGKEPVAIDGLAALLPGHPGGGPGAAAAPVPRAPRVAHGGRRRPSTRRSRPPPPDGVGSPGPISVREGEAKLAEQGVSVRCIIAADGSVPASDDQEGNIAIVARAY